ncbi:MAG: crossover junction endodeoxyribonuclease RuvC [bacterium]|nr:crossover junction endodeoxyribonuclease RuvC [bacterium]
MRIMGIDPGIAHTGYAVIDSQSQELSLCEAGIITTSSKTNFAERLKKIGNSLQELIEKYQPSEAAVEDIFIATSPRLALKLGEARGVAIYVATRCQVAIYEYTALQVKEAIVGYGRATKDQVRRMVQTLLNLKELKVHNDASDALAVAVCHCHSLGLRRLLSNLALQGEAGKIPKDPSKKAYDP